MFLVVYSSISELLSYVYGTIVLIFRGFGLPHTLMKWPYNYSLYCFSVLGVCHFALLSTIDCIGWQSFFICHNYFITFDVITVLFPPSWLF